MFESYFGYYSRNYSSFRSAPRRSRKRDREARGGGGGGHKHRAVVSIVI